MVHLRCPECGAIVEARARDGATCPQCGFRESPFDDPALALAASPTHPESTPPGDAGTTAWAAASPDSAGTPEGWQRVPPSGTTAHRTDGFAVAALVLGIVGLVTFTVIVTAALALVFGILALQRLQREPGVQGRGMAIAGIVMGAVGIFLGVVVGPFGMRGPWMMW